MVQVRHPLILVLLAAATLALAPGAARSAPFSGVLAQDAALGPIAAHGDTVAWSRWDTAAGGYRIVVDRGGRVRTLDVPPATHPFGLSAGRGPDGSTWLVWSRCGGDPAAPPTGCDIEAYDLRARAVRALPFAARAGVEEVAPAIDSGRLVWATGPATGARVHLATLDGSSDRTVDVLPPSTCALSIWSECARTTSATTMSSALSGARLAVTSRVSTGAGDVGICGWANVRLLDLQTGAVRTLDDAVCGLSGQALTDAAFDRDGRLWWRLSCGGDTSACGGTRAGPFRAGAAGPQRLVQDAASRLAGVTVAGRTPILLVRAPRTAPGCWEPVGGDQSAYRCGTVRALADPSFVPERASRPLPPPGYVTVKATRRLLVLRPPPTLACSVGDWRPQPGASVWAGASWTKPSGSGRTFGPAVPVTATSGRRTVRGTVPRAPRNHEGQLTTTLALGRRGTACGRRWTITYRPPGGAPVRFSTRVRPR